MRVGPILAIGVLVFAPLARAADSPEALVMRARERLQKTDSRASGRLVHLDENGKRTSQSLAIEAHWFPGVLRVLLTLRAAQTTDAQLSQTAPTASRDTRVSFLFEMRPGGQSTVQVFHPHAAPVSLPFSHWGEGVAESDFDPEDFLEPELYWQEQTVLPGEMLGTRFCDVLKSVPGPLDRSHYASVKTWFDHATGYPLREEKTLRNSGAVKEFTSLGLTQSGGVWAARQVEVKVNGHKDSSLLLFERGTAKAQLDSKDFSLDEVERSENHR